MDNDMDNDYSDIGDITWYPPHYIDINLLSSAINGFSAYYDLGDIAYIKDPDMTHIIKSGLQTYFYDFFTQEFTYGTVFAAQQAINECIYKYINNDITQLTDEDAFYSDLNIGHIGDIEFYPDEDDEEKIEEVIRGLDFKIDGNPKLSARVETILSDMYEQIKDKSSAEQFHRIQKFFIECPPILYPGTYCSQFEEKSDDIQYKNTGYRNSFIKIKDKQYSGRTDRETNHIIEDMVEKFNNTCKYETTILDVAHIYCEYITDFVFRELLKNKNIETYDAEDLEQIQSGSNMFKLFKTAYAGICPYYVKLLSGIFTKYVSETREKSTDVNVIDFLSRYSDEFGKQAEKYFKQEYLFSYMLFIFSLLPLNNLNIQALLANSARVFPTTLDKDNVIANMRRKQPFYSDTTSSVTSKTSNRLLPKILTTDQAGMIELYDRCKPSQKELEAISLSRYDAVSHYLADQKHAYTMNFAAPYEDAFYCNYKKYAYDISGQYLLREIRHSELDNGPYEGPSEGPDEVLSTFIDFGCQVKAAFPAFKDRLEDVIGAVSNKFDIFMQSIGNGPYVRKLIGSFRDAMCLEVDGTGQDQMFQISCCAMRNTCQDMPYIVSCDGYVNREPEGLLQEIVQSAAYHALCCRLSSYFDDPGIVSCNALAGKCSPNPAEMPDLCALAYDAYGQLDRTEEIDNLNLYCQNDMFIKPTVAIPAALKRYVQDVKTEYYCQAISDYYGNNKLDIYLKSNSPQKASIAIPSKKNVHVLIINEMNWSKYPDLDKAMRENNRIINNFKTSVKLLYEGSSIQVIYHEYCNIDRQTAINAMRLVSGNSNVILMILSHGGGGKYDKTLNKGFQSECFATVESDGSVSSIYDAEIYKIFQNTDNVVMFANSCYSGGLFNPKNEYNLMHPTSDEITSGGGASRKIKNFLIMCSDAPCSAAHSSISLLGPFGDMLGLFHLFVTRKNRTYRQVANNFNMFIDQVRNYLLPNVFTKFATQLIQLYDDYSSLYGQHTNIFSQYIYDILENDLKNGPLFDLQFKKFEAIMDGTEYTYNGKKYCTYEPLGVTSDSLITNINIASGLSYLVEFINKLYIDYKDIISCITDFNDTSDETIGRIAEQLKDKISFSSENEVKGNFSTSEIYDEFIDRYVILYDGAGINRAPLRELILKTKIEFTLKIILQFMTDCYQDSDIELTDTRPAIKKYNELLKNNYDIMSNDETAFANMIDLLVSFGLHDLPQIVQCRGSDKFMDQPFLRFVV